MYWYLTTFGQHSILYWKRNVTQFALYTKIMLILIDVTGGLTFGHSNYCKEVPPFWHCELVFFWWKWVLMTVLLYILFIESTQINIGQQNFKIDFLIWQFLGLERTLLSKLPLQYDTIDCNSRNNKNVKNQLNSDRTKKLEFWKKITILL